MHKIFKKSNFQVFGLRFSKADKTNIFLSHISIQKSLFTGKTFQISVVLLKNLMYFTQKKKSL